MTKKIKSKSIQERRQERLVQELKQKAKAHDLEVIDDELDEDIPEEDVEEEDTDALKKQIEEIEKDMGIDSAEMPMVGPTSFDELDAAEAAQEQAHEMMETGWDAQRLVYNIINHPMMDAKEKAGAIKSVGEDFGKRVSDILSASPDATQKDLDLLSLESILAHDKRNHGFIESLIDKAVLSTTARKKLSESDFALPSKRKYPIHDKAHVRNALARAAQQMSVGGEGAADAKAAMPKIRAAAKKFGIEMSMKKERNAIIVEKDANGDWRWIGWVSNNFQDFDGETIAEVAHKEYVQFLDENPAMAPAFITWHTPDTMRKSLPDFWDYRNGFLIMSGKLTEKEAGDLMSAATLTDLGMSHGTLVLARDPMDRRVITKYRMYEVSDLPLENAANPFTALETLSKEADMDKLAYLSQFIGKDRAQKAIEEQTAEAQKSLQAAGVTSKEKTETPPTAPAAEPNPPTAQTPAPDSEAVIKEVMERLDIPGLNEFVVKAQEAMEKVEVLEAAIKELAGSEDERLADKIAPPATTLAWSQKDKRPSEKTDNIVKEGDKAPGDVPTPGENWLSIATGTTPVIPQ